MRSWAYPRASAPVLRSTCRNGRWFEPNLAAARRSGQRDLMSRHIHRMAAGQIPTCVRFGLLAITAICAHRDGWNRRIPDIPNRACGRRGGGNGPSAARAGNVIEDERRFFRSPASGWRSRYVRALLPHKSPRRSRWRRSGTEKSPLRSKSPVSRLSPRTAVRTDPISRR